jgi:hypothetical protein
MTRLISLFDAKTGGGRQDSHRLDKREGRGEEGEEEKRRKYSSAGSALLRAHTLPCAVTVPPWKQKEAFFFTPPRVGPQPSGHSSHSWFESKKESLDFHMATDKLHEFA